MQINGIIIDEKDIAVLNQVIEMLVLIDDDKIEGRE